MPCCRLLSPAFHSAYCTADGTPIFDLVLGQEGIHGIWSFLTPPFIQRDEQIQCIVLWKQAPDISDVRSETNAYRMVLLEDGDGVEVYEPSLPKFMMVDDPSDFYRDMGPAMGNAL